MISPDRSQENPRMLVITSHSQLIHLLWVCLIRATTAMNQNINLDNFETDPIEKYPETYHLTQGWECIKCNISAVRLKKPSQLSLQIFNKKCYKRWKKKEVVIQRSKHLELIRIAIAIRFFRRSTSKMFLIWMIILNHKELELS